MNKTLMGTVSDNENGLPARDQMNGEPACPVEHPVKLRIDARNEDLVSSQVAEAHVEEVREALEKIHGSFVAEHKAYERDRDTTQLEERWRAWTVSHDQREIVEDTIRLARRARRRFEAFLLLGVGGSDLAARVIHDCLDSPVHNMLPDRGGAPVLHLAGDNFDPRPLKAILDSLRQTKASDGRTMLLKKTLINVVSRSGATAETLAALMVVKQALQAVGVNPWEKHVVATTAFDEGSELYKMRNRLFGHLPVPAGVGGRFSAASPVGLFTLAMTANRGIMSPRKRVQQALDGFCQGHTQWLLSRPGDETNVAFRLARWLHLWEHYGGKNNLVFYNYAGDRFLGDWVTQLYTESVQERGQGMNVIGTRGPTGNHSMLNGIIRGPRDKVVVFVHWRSLELERGESPHVPTDTGLSGDLADMEGLSLADIQAASYAGTAEEFTHTGIPNVTLEIERRDEASVFQLMRILMDTVAVKGRLQQLHCRASGALDYTRELTYRQDGVEGYKARMRAKLKDLQQRRLESDAKA